MNANSSSPSACPAWLTARPIAHRGLHRLPETPENSLAAFRAAADAGYPAELDVRLLADGQLAVFHDDTLNRLTGADGPLSSRTAADLRGETLRLAGTSEPIPLLDDVLDMLAGRTPLLIEVKSAKTDPVGPLEEALVRRLRAYDGPFALQSFRVPTVEALKRLAPEWCVGQLAMSDAWESERAADAPEPDFLAYYHAVLPTPLTTRFRERGVPLIAWTPATEQAAERVENLADNYIFDHLRPNLKRD